MKNTSTLRKNTVPSGWVHNWKKLFNKSQVVFRHRNTEMCLSQIIQTTEIQSLIRLTPIIQLSHSSYPKTCFSRWIAPLKTKTWVHVIQALWVWCVLFASSGFCFSVKLHATAIFLVLIQMCCFEPRDVCFWTPRNIDRVWFSSFTAHHGAASYFWLIRGLICIDAHRSQYIFVYTNE